MVASWCTCSWVTAATHLSHWSSPPSLSSSLPQVIKNPVTDHLPTGSLKVGTSFHADEIVDIKSFGKDKPVVFVVGAMAHGKVSDKDILI